jgi:hydroxyacylglutathione hydrolase
MSCNRIPDMTDTVTEIIPLPAFRDNYIWLLRRGPYAAVVDPGDADPVLDYLARNELALIAILNTHHHGDHVGGNQDLLGQFDVPVYGPRQESIPGLTQGVGEGDAVRLPEIGLEFRVIDVPGHTAGHVAYYRPNSLFCGDTLFGCGCGRLFEGTPEQMHRSLQKLAALPGDTGVYCAHEYTLSNIRFAKAVEPHNADLLHREEEAIAQLARHLPTVPSSIESELRTNPFLRASQPAVRDAAEHHVRHALTTEVQVFAALREWKNNF